MTFAPVPGGEDQVCYPGDKRRRQSDRGQPLASQRCALRLVIRARRSVDGIVEEDRQLDCVAVGHSRAMPIQQAKQRRNMIQRVIMPTLRRVRVQEIGERRSGGIGINAQAREEGAPAGIQRLHDQLIHMAIIPRYASISSQTCVTAVPSPEGRAAWRHGPASWQCAAGPP